MYKVADFIFKIFIKQNLESWNRIKWHFDPFIFDSNSISPNFNIVIQTGDYIADEFNDLRVLRKSQADTNTFSLNTYERPDGTLFFEVKYPNHVSPCGWIFTNKELNDFKIVLSSEDNSTSIMRNVYVLTYSLLFVFLLATMKQDTLTMHASCIEKDGKGYLFLGKSGTGKSTHSQLWLKNIADTVLLNDDHPIIRINEEGKAIVYGSPWSGKTDCYKNMHAEIGGIVKIKQAPENKIRRLSPIEAFIKMRMSASGMTWIEEIATQRHKTIEKVIATVPFYELECLPDDDAALLCHNTIKI